MLEVSEKMTKVVRNYVTNANKFVYALEKFKRAAHKAKVTLRRQRRKSARRGR